MRSRTLEDINIVLPAGQEHFSQTGTPDYVSGSIPGGWIKNQKVLTDEPHPGFRKRIANGELVIGPMSLTEVRSTAGGGSFTYTGPNNGKDYSVGGSVTQYYLNAASTVNTPQPSLLDIETLTEQSKLAAVANIDKTPFSFMEDFLTARESLNMLRDPLEGLNSWSKMFRQAADNKRKRSILLRNSNYKGQIRDTTKTQVVQAISDTYLSYRFGATPFVNSLASILEGIATETHGRPKSQRFRAGSKRDSHWGVSTIVTTNRTGQTFLYTRNITRAVRSGIFYQMRNTQSGLRWKYGLRDKDLPAGLWAAMPYSFMIDRVTDVSNYAQAITNLADPNVMIEGGYVTTEIIDESTIRALTPPTWSGWSCVLNGDTITNYYRGLYRQLWTPSIFNIRPAVDFSGLVSSATKVTDLCSLILQRLRP